MPYLPADHKNPAPDFARTIGRNLIYLRQSMQLSQQDIGQVLNISYQQVQKYEQGLNRLPLEKLYVLKRFYNVPYDFFFRDILEVSGKPSGVLSDSDLNIYLRLRMLKDKTLKKKIEQIFLILTQGEPA